MIKKIKKFLAYCFTKAETPNVIKKNIYQQTNKTEIINLANKVELPKKRKLTLKKEAILKFELKKLGIDTDKEV